MGHISGLVIDGKHHCAPPTHSVTGDESHFFRIPDGRRGDLWRCDHCRKLWEVRDACDMCERYGWHDRGQCQVGNKWRKATLGQRLRNWRKG